MASLNFENCVRITFWNTAKGDFFSPGIRVNFGRP